MPNSRSFVSTVIAISAAFSLQGCFEVEQSTNADIERALEQNELSFARAHLSEVFSSGTADDQTRMLQIEFFLRSGDGHGALAAIEKLPDSALSDSERRLLTSEAILLKGQPDKAVELFADLDFEQLSERDLEIILRAYYQMGDEGEEEFSAGMNAVLESYPNNPQFNFLAATRLLELGQIEEAREYADKALAQEPSGYDTILLSGQIAIAEGQLENAIESYKTAQELNPTSPLPIANIGGLQLDLGKVEEAGKTLKAALDKHPDEPFLNWQIARYYIAIEDLEKARSAIEKAKKQYASNAEFTLLFAQLHDKLGNHITAKVEYERYLKAVGSNEKVEARLAELQ